MRNIYVARRYQTPVGAAIQLNVSRDGNEQMVHFHAYLGNPYLPHDRTNNLSRANVSRETIVILRDTLNQVLEDWE